MKYTAESMVLAGSLLAAATAYAYEFPKKASAYTDGREKSPLICKFDQARGTIVVINKEDKSMRASMHHVYKHEGSEIVGHGTVYLNNGKTIDGPIKFTADFKDASCVYGSAGDTWGIGATKAPMDAGLMKTGMQINIPR